MQCPACKEEIKEGAVMCKHCHAFFVKIPQPFPVKVTSKASNWVVSLMFATILILAGYIFYLKNPDFTLEDIENTSPPSQENQNTRPENNE